MPVKLLQPSNILGSISFIFDGISNSVNDDLSPPAIISTIFDVNLVIGVTLISALNLFPYISDHSTSLFLMSVYMLFIPIPLYRLPSVYFTVYVRFNESYC